MSVAVFQSAGTKTIGALTTDVSSINEILQHSKNNPNNHATVTATGARPYVKKYDVNPLIREKERKQIFSFHTPTLTALLDGFYLPERAEMWAYMCDNAIFDNMHYTGLTLLQERELCQAQVLKFSQAPFWRFTDVITEPLRYMTFIEMLYYHGCNVATKAGVHYGLFGSTLMNLGSVAQQQQYCQDIHNLTVRGCFCLTELGHGSNARDIETTATYNHATTTFIINSPTNTSQKIYIGNLAQHATHAVVFAQLLVKGVKQGVHAFIVQIREQTAAAATATGEREWVPCKGIRIADVGPKSGLNGVDNGRCWFSQVHIPHGNILNRFGDVNVNSGEYESPIASESRRFTATIGQLIGGRIVVAQGGLNMAKVGIATAVRYAHTRLQFGDAGAAAEKPLMNYTSHQSRLMPALAATYALQFGLNKLKRMTLAGRAEGLSAAAAESIQKELHVFAAGLKPLCTWHKTSALQLSRECCGGMGFLSVNRIANLRNDSDIDVTWEGDNTVLLQQLAGSLLKEFQEQFKNRVFTGMIEYVGKQIQQKLNNSSSTWRMGSIDRSHLHDNSTLVNALEWREFALLRMLVKRLQHNKSVLKLSDFEQWNQALDLALALAAAHMDRELVVEFIAVTNSTVPSRADNTHDNAEAVNNSNTRPMLQALCSLFALSLLQKNMSFYVTFGYFSPAMSKAVYEELQRTQQVLSTHSVQLVDAFGIPDAMLGVIAGDWKKAYTYPQVPGYEHVPQSNRANSKMEQ